MVRVGSVKSCRALNPLKGHSPLSFGAGASNLSRTDLAARAARAINEKAKFFDPVKKRTRSKKNSAKKNARDRLVQKRLIEKARMTPFGKDLSDGLIKDALNGAGSKALNRNAFFFAATDLLRANPAKYPGLREALVRRRIFALADEGVLGANLKSTGKSVK